MSIRLSHDDNDHELYNNQTLRQRLSATWTSFSNFALRDNVLEIAIGLIIASSFTSVVNSFVSDLLLPIISLLPFIAHNLDEKFAVLKHGRTRHHSEYNTIQQALDDGAVVWAWGSFLDKCIRFIVIALVLFTLARLYGWASGDTVIKRKVKCKYCRKWISARAKRCVNCTSWQDGSHDI